MFISPHVPALFKKGTLKLVAGDDGPGLRRVAEALLVIEPFPPALAHELGEDIADHLFDATDAIRAELEAIEVRVRCGLQTVTVHAHEELPAVVSLTPASVKDVSVTRIEDKKTGRAWLSLSCVLVFSLEDKAARNFVLDEFGKTLLWTFTALQGELLSEAAIHDAAARVGELGDSTLTYADPDGTSSTIAFNKDTAKKHRTQAQRLRNAAERAH